MAEKRRTGKLAVILHADVAGSTDLVRRDEQLAHQRIQDTFRRFGSTITKFHGHVRELRGDALLAEFERASDAVTAALAFQADQIDYLAQLNDSIQPTVRVGIAMGEVIIADDTITGEGVVLAQRLEQLADSGGVVVQGAAYETIPGRFPFEYENLGEHEAKGFDEPVRAYRARLKRGVDLPQPTPTVHRIRNTVIATASVAIVSVGIALMWLKPWEVHEEPASIERMAFPLPDKPSIAVLPFDNLLGDPDQDYFVDGLTEDIITELSRFSELFVISRRSTFTYKGKAVKVGQVAEELGVRYVLEGSIRRTDTDLLVTAQLIDATSGVHIWAERYERPVTEFHAVQANVLNMIVSTVADRVENVGVRIANRKQTGNLGAYEHVLQGYALANRWNKESNEKARAHFEKAIELDPQYSRAYSGLAFTHNIDFVLGSNDVNATLSHAREASLRAIDLDDRDNRPRVTLGWAYVNGGDIDRGVAEIKKGISLNPNDAGVLARSGYALTYSGEFEQAIDQGERAKRINPFHPSYYYDVIAWAQYFLKQYDDALRTMTHIAKPRIAHHRTLAAVYVRLGQVDKARAHAKKILELDPDFALSTYAKTQPFKNPEHLEFHLESLRLAGLPDNPRLNLPDKPSIAVLPLDNMSDDASQDYFADGMTEDLITDLSKNPGLFVIARNSSFSYKGRNVKIRQVAEELGVRYVLEGSVRRAGDQVRINAQLIDASSGGHVWADRYDGQLTDIFALQDQVTKQIVKALKLSLTGAEVGTQAQHSTDNAEAHDAFLQGWSLFIQERPEFLAQAYPFFEKAVLLDENYSQAHAALASIIWDAQQNDWTLELGIFSFEVEERVEEHLEAALKSPTPLAHDLQARIYLSNSLFDKAVQEAEKAVTLDGNNATAHAALANALVLAGKPEEGAEAIGKAMRLDPHYPPSYLEILGATQFWTGKYDKAIETVKQAIERNPKNDLPRLYLAASYAHLGRINEGEAAMEAANYARNLRGLSPLSMEKSNEPRYTPFTVMAAIDFQAFGQKQNRDQIRADFLKIPALNWPYLVTTYDSSTTGHSWWEVEGATQIDAATAKSMHARGAKFIDTGYESGWLELHIPGAHSLPYYWPYLNKSSPDGSRNVLNRVALGEIVDKSDEVVFYLCPKNNPAGCSAPWEAAKAVSWGYQKVYFIDLSSTREWMKAGYTLD